MAKNKFEDIFLPLLAVAETIGTKGKSPGTAALGQRAAIQQGRQGELDRIRQEGLDAEALKDKAFKRKLGGFQMKKAEGDLVDAETKRTAANALAKRIEPYPAAWKNATTPEEKRAVNLEFIAHPEAQRRLTLGQKADGSLTDVEKLAAKVEAARIANERRKEHNVITAEAKVQKDLKTAQDKVDKEKRGKLNSFVKINNKNQNLINSVNEAEKALEIMPAGISGAALTSYRKKFSPNHPSLAAWQKVKSALINAQLNFTSRTKGAISDKEMEIFAAAAANDEIPSPARIKEVFNTLRKAYVAEANGEGKAYKSVYKEDPYELAELQPLDWSPLKKEKAAKTKDDPLGLGL